MNRTLKILLAVALLFTFTSAVAQAQRKPPVYFAIIGSLPTHRAANHMVGQAARAGLNAQVVQSSRYPYLTPGYWIVTVGRSTSRGQAQRMADDARRKGFRGAYAKRAL